MILGVDPLTFWVSSVGILLIIVLLIVLFCLVADDFMDFFRGIGRK